MSKYYLYNRNRDFLPTEVRDDMKGFEAALMLKNWTPLGEFRCVEVADAEEVDAHDLVELTRAEYVEVYNALQTLRGVLYARFVEGRDLEPMEEYVRESYAKRLV